MSACFSVILHVREERGFQCFTREPTLIRNGHVHVVSFRKIAQAVCRIQ